MTAPWCIQLAKQLMITGKCTDRQLPENLYLSIELDPLPLNGVSTK